MILPIFIKSLKEQLRNGWILLLTVSLAPFFVFVYYLINEASQPSYTVQVLELEQANDSSQTAGSEMLAFFSASVSGQESFPLHFSKALSREDALARLQRRSADVLLVLPENFTASLAGSVASVPQLEIVGDLSQTAYLVAAVWLGELMNAFIAEKTNQPRLFDVIETALGSSGGLSEFDLWMPGMLTLSIIMLMFSATIAFIAEVDQKTMLRLKLSAMKAWQFLAGVGLTQVLVALLSLCLTLLAACSLGFTIQGSPWTFLLIVVLTSLSMIAFSLILAAFTRSVTEVLIVGNFPLFLFMFFTGAAFPITAQPWFSMGGYDLSWQSLMSPTHAISALHKISILGSGIGELLPEILALCSITLIYLGLGLWTFKRRHLQTR